MAREVKARKKCCRDSPRCKRCPVVCRKLAAKGYLERASKRRFIVLEPPTKKALKAARAR